MTYLKLPWRPLIAVEGSTLYDPNDEYKIVRHVESWNISPLETVGQIFTPGSKRPSEYLRNNCRWLQICNKLLPV
ncbi:hypothetical protein KSS87_022356 [Heliosperma pusillum]|nr:hypothetical protein KSS87_022356 [Heliosperma pusillum]